MQTFIGTVISKKTPNTVAVTIPYYQKHPKYQKILKRITKILVHNEIDEIKNGDTVKIIKSKPYSKNKHFKTLEIISSESKISAESQNGSVKPEAPKKVVKKTDTKVKGKLKK